jgi:hypothetical protein
MTTLIQWLNDSIPQFSDQRLRLLQVLRVKPLGEPVVTLCVSPLRQLLFQVTERENSEE